MKPLHEEALKVSLLFGMLVFITMLPMCYVHASYVNECASCHGSDKTSVAAKIGRLSVGQNHMGVVISQAIVDELKPPPAPSPTPSPSPSPSPSPTPTVTPSPLPAKFQHAKVFYQGLCQDCHKGYEHGKVDKKAECSVCHVSFGSVLRKPSFVANDGLCSSCHLFKQSTPACLNCHGTSSNPHLVAKVGLSNPHTDYKPVPVQSPAPIPTPTVTVVPLTGAKVFAENCASCHTRVMPSVPFRAGVATSHHGRRITLSAEQISVLKQFIAESPATEEEDD